MTLSDERVEGTGEARCRLDLPLRRELVLRETYRHGDYIEIKDAVARLMRTLKELESDRGSPLRISLRSICDACAFSSPLVKSILEQLVRDELISLPQPWASGNLGNVREFQIAFDLNEVARYSLELASECRSFRRPGRFHPAGKVLYVGNRELEEKFLAEDEVRRQQQEQANAIYRKNTEQTEAELAATAIHRARNKCGACGRKTDFLNAQIRLYLHDYNLQDGVHDASWLIAICDDCRDIVDACYLSEEEQRARDAKDEGCE